MTDIMAARSIQLHLIARRVVWAEGFDKVGIASDVAEYVTVW